MKMTASTDWFTEARYGLFIHYGLYSLLERGEWVWNREEIPLEEYKQLAARFTAKYFDADKLGRMAVDDRSNISRTSESMILPPSQQGKAR